MRPLKLTISAFGSYGGKEELDLEKIGHGIFLVTGDTGAGKTTIFDAISFALFGDMSGAGREGSMMRSQYAGPAEETWVELIFSEGKDRYRILRSPQYLRMGKRKNKNGENVWVQSAAKVSLFMPDGREFPGNIRDVNRKIQEIIGIDKEQFSQIAMIAQGEYMKLLQASSRDRKEIFSRIFHTGIYQRIQQELRDRDKKLYGKLEDLRKLCLHEMEKADVGESPLREAWNEVKQRPETGMEQILSVLDQVILEEKEREERLSGEREKIREERSSLEYRQKTAKENNLLLEKKEKAQALWEELKDQEEGYQKMKKETEAGGRAAAVSGKEADLIREMKELADLEQKKENAFKEQEQAQISLNEIQRQKKKRLEEISSTLPELEAELQELRRQESMYEELEKSSRIFAEKQAAEKMSLCTYSEAEELWTEWKQQTADLQKEESALSDSSLKLGDWKARLEECRIQKEKLFQLEETEKEEKEAEKKWEAGIKRLKQSENQYETISGEYEQLYRSFLSAQAGLMAASLTEGEACPVCGSTVHPKKAILRKEAASEDQVNRAKEEKEKASVEWRKQAEATGKAESVLTGIREQLEALRKELGINDRKEREEDRKALEEQEKEALLQVQDLEKKAERFQTLRKELALRQEQREGKERQVRELEEKWRTSQEERKLAEEEKERRRREVRFSKKEEADQRKRVLEKDREKLTAELQEWEEKEKSRSEQLRELNGRIHAMEDTAASQRQNVREAAFSFHSELKKQGFLDEEAFRRAFMPEKEIREKKEQLEAYAAEKIRAEAALLQLKEQTEGKEWIDTSGLEASAEQKKEEEDRVQKELDRVLADRRCNEDVEKEIRLQLKAREELEKEYSTVHLLSQAANGRLAGAAGLDFQTYIQRRYFRQMIQAANKRLAFMTEGRFLLKCRDMDQLGKQGEVGLDLDIYSLETDQIRDVKTLSGGESFMAALSMALGMADIIQNNSGSVHLDMMFIDEGFGTLDEESRTRAVQVLQQLAGEKRTIGLISHVTELKEQMDRKLVIWKDKKGSHMRWEE